jgi:hypothetical protein
MRVKCKRDNTIFTTEPVAYPSEKRQSTFHCKDGDKFIECPTCRRRYFLYSGIDTSVPDGQYYCDRPLIIL